MTGLATTLEQGLLQLGVGTTPQQRQKMLDFLALLAKWNRSFNLTAIDDPEQMVRRHLLDSLTLAPFVTGATILDIGSGAGFPGIPLAILFPHKQFVLLDSNGKKTRFLLEARRQLGLVNLEVENKRVEHYQSPHQIDIVTSRAFSSLRETVELLGPLLTGNTRLLAMKGPDVQQEIRELPAGVTVSRVMPVQVPGIDKARHIIEIQRQG